MATIHGAISTHDITADQALGVMANLAVTTLSGGGPLQDAFAAEVAALINAYVMTADHAVAALSAIAGNGSANLQRVVGHEIGTLITGGQMTAAQAMTDIAQRSSHGMTADQAIVVLAGVSATVDTDNSAQLAVVAEMGTLVASGQITADPGDEGHRRPGDGPGRKSGHILQTADQPSICWVYRSTGPWTCAMQPQRGNGSRHLQRAIRDTATDDVRANTKITSRHEPRRDEPPHHA